MVRGSTTDKTYLTYRLAQPEPSRFDGVPEKVKKNNKIKKKINQKNILIKSEKRRKIKKMIPKINICLKREREYDQK